VFFDAAASGLGRSAGDSPTRLALRCSEDAWDARSWHLCAGAGRYLSPVHRRRGAKQALTGCSLGCAAPDQFTIASAMPSRTAALARGRQYRNPGVGMFTTSPPPPVRRSSSTYRIPPEHRSGGLAGRRCQQRRCFDRCLGCGDPGACHLEPGRRYTLTVGDNTDDGFGAYRVQLERSPDQFTDFLSAMSSRTAARPAPAISKTPASKMFTALPPPPVRGLLRRAGYSFEHRWLAGSQSAPCA
jgi:hypothetical protein